MHIDMDTGTDGRTSEWQSVLLCVRVCVAWHESNLISLSLFVVELVLPFVHPLDEHHSTTVPVADAPAATIVIVVSCCWRMYTFPTNFHWTFYSSTRTRWFEHRFQVFFFFSHLHQVRLMRMHFSSISNYHVAKQHGQTLFQRCCATAGRRQTFVYINCLTHLVFSRHTFRPTKTKKEE